MKIVGNKNLFTYWFFWLESPPLGFYGMKVSNIISYKLSGLHYPVGFPSCLGALCLAVLFLSCEDTFTDTVVTESTSDDYFTLTLTLSADNVRLDESIQINTELKRRVHKDSVDISVTLRMMVDAVGGTINGHNFSLASNITVSLADEKNVTFKTLSSFIPSSSYDKAKKEYYNYMSMGRVTTSFNNLNISIPVQLVKP